MVERRPSWALIVHGGAKEIPPEKEEANRAGCLAALAEGRRILAEGGSAPEAVEAAIRVLEDDGAFNAGRGSVSHSDGALAMDAALMDGATLDVGAVAALQGVRHPIRVARMLLRETPVLLVSEGARRFAEEHGAELAPGETPAYGRDAAPIRRDTVGAVALDSAGHLASGTSTGGLQDAAPGRVGDSPMPGAGFYADDQRGAVAFSGDGESIVRLGMAATVMHRIGREGAEQAIASAIAGLEKVGGEAGGIALDPQGGIGWTHNGPNFAVAYVTSDMNGPRAFLRKTDESASDHG